MKTKNIPKPRLLSVKEASTLYNITPYSLRHLIHDGKLATVHLGNKYLINEKALDDALYGTIINTNNTDDL